MNADPLPTDKADGSGTPLPETALILAAAGKSSRFGAAMKKPFVSVAGKPVWLHAVEPFIARAEVRQVLVVLSPEDREFFVAEFSGVLDRLRRDVEVVLVDGGRERVDSVTNALNLVSESCGLVAVHDAARPCVTPDCIDAVFRAAARTGAALPAVPVVATLKRGRDSGSPHILVETTVSRDALWEAQTPQVFWRRLLLDAYRRHVENRTQNDRPADALPTDDCELVERLGHPVEIVPGNRTNIKITTADDLDLAGVFLRSANTDCGV